jgi:hypothetical protein
MKTTNTAKTIVENVLTVKRLKELWTVNYTTVLPFTPTDFAIEALLPAIMYMFRRGHRRGMGQFQQKFKGNGAITAERMAEVLINEEGWFEGFEEDVTKSILADMLLTYCVENKGHATGRTIEVIRAFPTHYFASWIDLPMNVGHLRFVPEMIVAILTEQKEGTHIEPGKARSRFSTAQGFDHNELLKHFSPGVSRVKPASDLMSDEFEEQQVVGLDQLLTIRVAQHCGSSPIKLRGAGENHQIANRRPLALGASNIFRSDFTTFLDAFSECIPRQALVSMLESCMSLGLSTMVLSSALMVLDWERKNAVQDDCVPWQLFVDASLGEDNDLRRLSEESFDELLRRLDRLPTILMTLRVLEQALADDEETAGLLRRARQNPHGLDIVNLLGDIRSGTHSSSRDIEKELKRTCVRLAEALEEQEEHPSVVEILRTSEVHPATRLGEALVILMGDGAQRAQFVRAIDSCMMMNAPNGLGRRRKVMISASGRKRLTEARSIVLTNTMLDFLVHRHLRRGKRGSKEQSLSLMQFSQVIVEKYGLCIDRSPVGMTIPVELLRRNKTFLERRLRDLGLLVGVNDAESMKRLQARFLMEADSDE